MTVAELVEKLRALPQDLPVLVDGYEGGLQDPEAPRLTRVHLGANEPVSYDGPHEECERDNPDKKNPDCWYCDERKPPVSERREAVVIER